MSSSGSLSIPSTTRQSPAPPSDLAHGSTPTISAPEDHARVLRQQALLEISHPSSPAGPPIRHLQYYDMDGRDSVIFLVENAQLFRIFRPSLIRRSETLKAMFSMPPGEGKLPHGESDNDPVVLPPSVVTVERFELFLAWLYQDRDVPSTLSEALTLLYLADYLDVPELLKRMTIYVATLPSETIPPAERVFLYRRYHFSNTDWLRTAFSDILEGTFTRLTVADLTHLGIPTVHLLIGIFRKLDRHRNTLAIKPPPATHESDCQDPENCEMGWLNFWATKVSPLLLSETPASGSKITRALGSWSASPWPSMNFSCMWSTAQVVASLTTIIGADRSFIASAVSQLVAFSDY
ncbi:hypothetical protein M407DRAFT_30563 [Tulasnella calospora MUT 4182]|uniref:BTB domain-containing protein n=1 Tax=Tulasnella calospora MUT 4182 TaxID=1051891 RepID=A0A0C3KE92_9AGAM|nr:hypothetical protein M407DRAFT_30563 [Tulasnella calospora MUT 4182]